MLRKYLRIKSESLTQIRTTIAELLKFFYGIVFIGASCSCLTLGILLKF